MKTPILINSVTCLCFLPFSRYWTTGQTTSTILSNWPLPRIQRRGLQLRNYCWWAVKTESLIQIICFYDFWFFFLVLTNPIIVIYMDIIKLIMPLNHKYKVECLSVVNTLHKQNLFCYLSSKTCYNLKYQYKFTYQWFFFYWLYLFPCLPAPLCLPASHQNVGNRAAGQSQQPRPHHLQRLWWWWPWTRGNSWPSQLRLSSIVPPLST